VVDKNYAAIDRGGEYQKLVVKPEWANLPDDEEKQDNAPAFVKELVRPINAQAGDLLPVSAFVKHGTVDGSWEVLGQAKRPKVERVPLLTRSAVWRPSFLLGTRTARTCLLGSSKNCADICPGNPKLGKALTMVPFNPDAADMKKGGTTRLLSVSGRVPDH